MNRKTLPEPLRRLARWTMRRTVYRRAFYKPRVEDRPFLVRLDTNNTCNLRCRKCFYIDYLEKGIPRRHMPLEEFRVLAERIFPFTYFLQLSCAFEPLMHPDFPEMLRETDRYDIENVGMVTNGVLLEGERTEAILASRSLKALAVSMDAIEPEIYERVRGRDVALRVQANVEAFLRLLEAQTSSHLRVQINALVMRSTLHELPCVLQWALDRGVREVQFFHVQPIDSENDESLVADPEAFNSMRDRLLEMARASGCDVLLPPPMRPEFLDAATGQYIWPQSGGGGSGRRELSGPTGDYANRPYPEHPYPKGVFCISPWMTLSIDAWGNLYPCSYRNSADPMGNIISQPLVEAINSLETLRLRQAILNGQHRRSCPFCRTMTPYADPMKHRIVHARQDESATASHQDASVEIGPDVCEQNTTRPD